MRLPSSHLKPFQNLANKNVFEVRRFRDSEPGWGLSRCCSQYTPPSLKCAGGICNHPHLLFPYGHCFFLYLSFLLCVLLLDPPFPSCLDSLFASVSSSPELGVFLLLESSLSLEGHGVHSVLDGITHKVCIFTCWVKISPWCTDTAWLLLWMYGELSALRVRHGWWIWWVVGYPCPSFCSGEVLGL